MNQDTALYRLGAASAMAIAALYVVITGLYVVVGAVPSGGEAWLAYLGPHTTAWWAIAGLSVLTDLLFVPLALALYRALRGVHGAATLVGAGLLATFAVLDLAVTWPNYAALISLSGDYGAASDAQRMMLVAAASYPSAVLGSILFAAYVILLPSLAILAIGYAQQKARVGRLMAFLALATGISGVIAVGGPLVVPELGLVAVLTSILTTAWLALVGLWLRRRLTSPIVATTVRTSSVQRRKQHDARKGSTTQGR